MSNIPFFVILLLITLNATAQTVSMDELPRRVEKNHPAFKQTTLVPELERMNQKQLPARQDWVFESQPSLMYSEPISTNPFPPTRISTATLQASMSRLFWSSGGRVSVGWTSDVTDQDLPSISFPTPTGQAGIPTGLARLYTHALSVNYTQPLLQNHGGILNRLPYELSDHAVSIAELNAAEQQEKLLLQFGVDFID